MNSGNMKKWKKRIALITCTVVVAIAGHIYYLTTLNGNEDFQEDTYLDKVTAKTALIVVAHDDDAISCSGTISELAKKGWKVHLLTFYGKWRAEDNPIRKKEVAKMVEILHMKSIDLIDFSLQKTDTVKEPWMPISYSKFSDYLNIDSLQFFVAAAIEKYQPTVVFTLDNITGAYGHPEHVCVSQCVINVCNQKKHRSQFSVKKIYQSVFTRSQSENILGDNPTYQAAKKVYKADGMPIPDCEITISGSAKEKKQTMLAFASQHRNLKKFWKYYHWYPSWIYFNIFDKEYFRVITID